MSDYERQARKKLKAEYGALFADFAEILFRLDPAGINFEINPDEYEPEVGTILPRVFKASSDEEVTLVVREELRRWFGAGISRPGVTYEQIGRELYRALCKHRGTTG